MNKQQQAIKEFEEMRNLAELKALSNKSLQEPLSNKEFERMMDLKQKIFGG